MLSAERDKETKEAFIFKNEMYKVSLIYGSKLILASEKLYHCIKLYIDHLGLSLIGNKHWLDRERYLFVPSSTNARSTKALILRRTLSNCSTKTCEGSRIFEGKKEIYKRMTCSRILFSVISELLCLGEDSLDNIAFCFGKHSKDDCKKDYIQFYSTRDAAKVGLGMS